MDNPENNIPLKKQINSQSFCSHISKQIFDINLLLWKNLLIFSRNSISTFIVIFSPFFICLVLILFQYISNYVANENELNPPIMHAPLLPKCLGIDCTTFGYGIIGSNTEWIDYVLEYVAKRNNMNRTTDFKMIHQGLDSAPYFDYLNQNPNKTMIGALFCTVDEIVLPFNISGKSISMDFSCNDLRLLNRREEFTYTYAIVYNKSFLPSTFFASQTISAPKDIRAFALKVSIDNALISYTKAKQDFGWSYDQDNIIASDSIEVLTQDYPKVPNRLLQNIDIVAAYGAFYFLIPPLFIFLTIQNEIVNEKEKHLRQYLNIVGVSHKTYWISWMITSVIFSFLIALSITIFGIIFNFAFFLNTPFFMILFLFFIFSLSMQFVSYFIAILVPTLKLSNTVSYSFLLFAWVIEMLMSNIVLIYQLYNDSNADWVIWFRRLLTLYPPFNFSKAFGDISQKSGYYFDYSQNRWIQGPGYNWADLLVPISGQKSFSGEPFDAPRTLDALLYMIMDGAIFALLGWYFDHVLSSNRGHSMNVFFFLMPRFWCKRRNIYNKGVKSKIAEENVFYSFFKQEENFNTADQEKERILYNLKEGIKAKGIRLVEVSRTFFKNSCGCRSKNDVHAVDKVYLEIDEKELIAFLGHNGAGKTTLINMMIGVLNTTGGKIFINNLDVEENIDEIRKILGVCPQFDILWDQLTAEEHLKLFCKIKNLPNEDIVETIDKKLEDVSLSHVKKALIKTFSGGMKRRLSMTIACVGNPKIIFLDEPTTGMDPKSRRQVFFSFLSPKFNYCKNCLN